MGKRYGGFWRWAQGFSLPIFHRLPSSLGDHMTPADALEPASQDEHAAPVTSSSQVIATPAKGDAEATAGDERQIFALIIGINKYKNQGIPELSGCINDCNNILHFLTTYLCVPQSHIIVVTNEAATRHTILYSFENHLVQNSRIKKGDAILFFYAGHGSRVEAPSGWLADDNMIETICPYDERTRDAHDDFIHGIPDRTIDGLMRRLALHKGDNITAIFDSCHSGGISRISGVGRFLPPAPSTPPFPDNLDRDIWAWGLSARTAQVALPQGFIYQAMSSHVLLAACRQEEVALEAVSNNNEPCGAFTNSLIQALQGCSIGETTYSALVERIQKTLRHQHPQCEGTNKDRVLFNAFAMRDRSKSFRVFKQRDVCYVAAGSIHGVVVGTQFTMPSDAGLCVLAAVAVETHRCVVTCESQVIPNDARVEISKWNNPKLNVYFHQPTGNLFSMVYDADRADIVVLRNDQAGLLLERFDPLVRRYANQLVPIKYEVISEALDAISHFNYHLYRHNDLSPVKDLLTVRLHRLEKQQSNRFIPIYAPAGDDLLSCDAEPIIYVDRGPFEVPEVKEAVIPDNDNFYGLTLENHSQLDLFPYLFYFDPSDYSIQSWYLPPSATMSPPLPKQKSNDEPSKLSIGYGASGTDAIQFSLPPGARVDSGFLKVFVSSAYVDMAFLKQDSPLVTPPRLARSMALPFSHIWDAWTFVLTVIAQGNLDQKIL